MTASPATGFASTYGTATGQISPYGSGQVLGWGTNTSLAGVATQPSAGSTIAPVSNEHVAPMTAWSTPQRRTDTPIVYEQPSEFPMTDRQAPDILVQAKSRMRLVPDSVLDELAADPAMWPGIRGTERSRYRFAR